MVYPRGTGAEAHLGCHPNASLKACSTVSGYSNYGTAGNRYKTISELVYPRRHRAEAHLFGILTRAPRHAPRLTGAG